MARVYLIVGPVGAGKSTFSRQLCQEKKAVHLALDEWMVTLFRPDRPENGVMEWYVERTQRCIEQIWRTTQRLIEVGTNVVLEIGLIQQHQRLAFYQRVDVTSIELTVYVLDAPRELRRERVLQRNQEKGCTFSMVVPPEIFELASDMWEPLTDEECVGREVHFKCTEESYV